MRWIDAGSFTYVLMDQRGYGDSRTADGACTVEEIAADAIVLADSLGWENFSVVGHSMGGKVAQRLVADAPERVTALAGVKNDLISIAQAERLYYVQNNSYADLPTLASSGTMNITRTSRGGYTYMAESSGTGFTVTATYVAPPLQMPNGVAPPHFPTYSVDQTMEIHQGD